MTEDTSPENLRKFLKNDDPALVRMGLSLAKGVGVPDEMLMEILWMYMFHDDKTIRAAAKSTFIKLAPKDAKQALKENWKASYRTDFISSSEYFSRNQYGSQLGILGKALCQTSLGGMTDESPENLRKFLKSDDPAMRRKGLSMAKGSGVPEALYKNVFVLSLWDPEEENREPAGELVKKIGLENIPEFPFVRWLIKALRDKDIDVRLNAAQALGIIGDERAVEPLIKALRDKNGDVCQNAAQALETLGDARAVEPLIKLLESSKISKVSQRIWWVGDMGEYMMGSNYLSVAARALGTFGDLRAVESLIKALGVDDFRVRQDAAKVLVQFGEPAMDPLLAKLEDKDVSDFAAEILEKLGKSVVKPLIKVLNEGSSKARNAAVEALGNIGDKDAVKPLITVLGDKDSAMRFSAVEALGKIGDERAVKPLIASLGDKDRSVNLSAAEALASNAWTKKGNDEICRSLIEAFEDDWLLAGLVLWSCCDTGEILYQSVSEKLSVSPNAMVFNHWKNVSVSRKFIRSRSGLYRVGGGVLEICMRQTMCRGSDNVASPLFPTYGFGRKCKGAMVRGDLRLGVELPNPNNPQYMTTYYYCASCVSTYIDIQKRYDMIEKWWPQSLKATQIANKRQAKEKAEKEKKAELAKKKKEKMKTRWLSISKGTVTDEIFEEILWTYLFHDDKTIRAAAKSTFIKLAPEDAKQAVKQNWKASYRKDWYEPKLGILGKALCQTSVSLVGPLVKALGDKNYEFPNDKIRVDVRQGAAKALGEIGDERAVEPLMKALRRDSYVRWSAVVALGKIGKSAVEPLIGVLSDDNWRVREYAVRALGEIGDERAVEPLIKALGDWEDGGVPHDAAKEALKKLGHEVE